MKVAITFDNEDKVFENVTSVEEYLGLDSFLNEIKIFQGEKVTRIKEHQIISTTITDE